jgi:hypothetical protein
MQQACGNLSRVNWINRERHKKLPFNAAASLLLSALGFIHFRYALSAESPIPYIRNGTGMWQSEQGELDKPGEASEAAFQCCGIAVPACPWLYPFPFRTLSRKPYPIHP